MASYKTIARLLIDIENELRTIDCWSEERPEDVAFQSKQPFFVDTMSFPQWLQFVFIERIKVLVESTSPLPESCGIAPMAEEYFRVSSLTSEPLIIHLKKLDEIISSA